ncbi:Glycine receptor subunit alpha-2 [Chionoecetes opilio]|uniref:Glycine receptor subunit alpha-2 n=1 Tax=Chionoecetes opilio TaxID=41210 RepID=A0A8J5CHM4_CHIOP|nr:Glycine receptor subunit alpha-2 [Chionoecetes opilio]
MPPPREAGHKPPANTRYPFTAGWTGARVLRKQPIYFRSARGPNPGLRGCEPSVLPLHYGVPLYGNVCVCVCPYLPILPQVWVPDVFIRGTRSIDTFELLQKFQGVVVSSDLSVFTSIMMQLKLVCSMSFQMYPFDVQRCTIELNSYGYQLEDLRFYWMPPGLNTDADVKKQLAGYDFSVKSVNGTTCSCTDCFPAMSACLRVRLVLRRHSFIHVMSSYVPSGLFVLVGWTSFFWPPEVVPGRTVLVITSLLTITSMYTGIRQTSPTTSYVKALDVWMLMCILFTTLPLLQYALILSWRRKFDEVSVTKVVPGQNGASSEITAASVYETRKRRAELVGRVGLPLCFLLFNFAYWPTYLNSSLQPIDLDIMSRWQTEPGILRGSAFPSGPLNLPQGLDIQPTIVPPTFRSWGSSSANEDIVVLAEFSEIEGPMPMLSIPQLSSLQIDLNEFVVKVLSTDYLNTSGEFRVYEDTQLVQQDLTPGVHVYVHYFTLYDVRARGFVRPMCLSYISADHRKLLHYFSHLKQKFTAATEFLKMCNFALFTTEMEGLIEDLEYTKDRYIQTQRTTLDPTTLESTRQDSPTKEGNENGEQKVSQGKNNHGDQSSSVLTEELSHASNINLPNSYQMSSKDVSPLDVSDQDTRQDVDLSPIVNIKSQEEEESLLLKHTTLESLATQLMECQHILDVIRPHMEKKDVEEDLHSLGELILSKPHSPLCKAMKDLNMLEKPELKTQRTICIMSLMKRNFHDMRSIQQLCGVGYVGCLFQLRTIYDKFCKPFLTLRFEDLDSEIYKNPFGSLFIGNIPVINILKDEENSKPRAQTSPYAGLCWDAQFVKFLRNGTSHVSTPDSEYEAAMDNPLDIALVSAAADCLKVFSRAEERNSSSVHSPERNNKSESSLKQDAPGTPKDTKEKKDAAESPGLEERKDSFHSQCSSNQMTTEKKGSGTEESRKVLVTQSSVSSVSSWVSNTTLDLVGYEDIQEEEGVEEDVSILAKGEIVPQVDIDNRKVISKVCRLAGLVQQFCGVSHCLVHSLLSGRPVLIAAEEIYKPTVTLYVRALATLLPRTPTSRLPILRWHTGTVTEHHLHQYRVMGVCIPERLHVQDLMSNATLNQVTVLNIETGHISGVAYSGTLVRGVEHYGRKLFHSNSALQVCLQSIIVGLGLKVYMLHHLMGVTNRTTAEILKGLGVAKGDWDIIMYLTGLIQKQLRMKLETS